MLDARRWKAFLAPLIVVVALGLALWFAPGMRTPPRTSLDLIGFVDGDIIRLAAEVPGPIQRVPVEEGSSVRAGDVVAALEREDFQIAVDQSEAALATARARVAEAEKALALEQAQSEARIEEAHAALDRAKDLLDQALETAELARKEHERSVQLFKEQVGTQQEMERRETEAKNAQAALLADRAQVREREAALRLAEASREAVQLREAELETRRRLVREAEVAVEQARSDLRDSVIVAPIPGTILTREALPGEIVQIGSPIASIVNLDELWVAVDVEESFVAQIHLGDAVEVLIPSLPSRSFPGRVVYVSQQSGFATQRDIGRNKVDVMTFRIKVAVDNAERTFKVGMTARVRIPLAPLTGP